eukprot:2284008-Pleurochrysis_carterae.AAC.2
MAKGAASNNHLRSAAQNTQSYPPRTTEKDKHLPSMFSIQFRNCCFGPDSGRFRNILDRSGSTERRPRRSDAGHLRILENECSGCGTHLECSIPLFCR